MALMIRVGLYGQYWGDTPDSSHALTYDQECINANYIWQSLGRRGWTKNAVAAMLGNMQSESSINPGRWEGNNVGVGPGYGLVQWTPYTKYTQWAPGAGYGDYSEMDANLARIEYEVANGLQWIPTSAYPMTFQDFKESTDSAYNLAMAFLANYERPADPNQPQRGDQAQAWFEYLGGITPTKKKKHHFKFVLTQGRRRRQRNG